MEYSFFFFSLINLSIYLSGTRSQCLCQEIQKTYLASLLIQRQNHSKLQAKFRKKFNFNNHPQNRQIHRYVHKFQATGSLNNFNKKAENPKSGRKLTARCPDNVDAVRDSVGRNPKKIPPKRIQGTWSFKCTVG